MVALIIALLEDSSQHAELKGSVRGAGHEIIVVDTFLRAKALLKEHSFDLIISDVHLQNGGSVFDFLRWVRSQDELKAVPFVLLSIRPTEKAKYLLDGVRTAARCLGATRYIVMDDFDAERLAREIADLLPDAPPIALLATGE